MNKRYLKHARMLLLLGAIPQVHAAVDLSAQAYDVYFGDFNGDTKGDVLYVAKSPSGASGVNLSDGGSPSIVLQRWGSSYLGIPWSGNQYTVTVADFNGDQRSDLLLQTKTSGDSYLLFANPQGRFVGIDQWINIGALGVTWSADQHRIVAGDFNHDGKSDLFFQATTASGTNAVLFADSAGKFTGSSPSSESWSGTYLGLRWSTMEAIVAAGNFDGLNGADLLVQAKPKFVMIDYDVPFPVPVYPPDSNGLVFSQASSLYIAGNNPVVQRWSRNAFNGDWSTLASNVIVGDFDGNGRSDVLLQAKSAGKPSVLLSGNSSGAAFTSISLDQNVNWPAYKLSAQNFSGSTAGIYFQGLTAATPNVYSNSIGGSVSTNPVPSTFATDVVEYSYDALGRLVNVARSGAASNNGQVTYAYDEAGNRKTVSSTLMP